MGLLTDPSAGQGKLTQALVKYYSKLCVLLYVGGVVWFGLLAYHPLNAGTYFSENALLPGLVKSEFRDDYTARLFYEELLDEMKSYDTSLPYPWIMAKFRQIGLDTYTHNFSLNYPLGKSQKFSGKNVYGILRAARAASTESLVLSAPYRPPSSVHAPTGPSIAIMLAFAKFANKEKYWSKDIIFLITEHEQLGMQAWLEAYHSVTCGKEDTLDHGDLRGRAGAIQAAINLEFHDYAIGRIDVKIEGLNGQLPNLDLFNLANRMCIKEGVYNTFKNKSPKNWRDPFDDWKYAFHTLMTMVSSQATGIPDGNHGLFHRFGIEALTMEGFSSTNNRSKVGYLTMGRILEDIFRSLNNLLERFHQSFFFYLLPSSERYISIGLYFPSICLIAGTLFIKACALWFQLQENPLATSDKDESAKPTKSASRSIDLVRIGAIFLTSHIVGVTIMNMPQYATQIGLQNGYNTDVSIYVSFATVSATLLLTPFLIKFQSCRKSITILNILSLLELGTTLICVSMHNFSLGLLCGVLYAPLALVIGTTSNRLRKFAQTTIWLIVHPFVVINIVVLVYSCVMFSNDTFVENCYRALRAAQQALVFSIVDSMIYGNWLYNLVTAILLPNWLCFWYVIVSKSGPKMVPVSVEKKDS